jgi:hypothetical protein
MLGVAGMIMINSLTKTTNSNTSTATHPTAVSSTSTPTVMPTLATSYVEVDYQTVGWFYYGVGYNYTYLVLNVTITNHGYSQVNVIGSYGFSVVVNGDAYQALFSSYSLSSIDNASIINKAYNVFQEFYDFSAHTFCYSFLGSDLPNPATLLDTGSVNGLVIFQFGNPNVYPQQPQILNEPFVLQYSVTYGNENFPPNAKVIINQTG